MTKITTTINQIEEIETEEVNNDLENNLFQNDNNITPMEVSISFSSLNSHQFNIFYYFFPYRLWTSVFY
jgi:hypothetical protein